MKNHNKKQMKKLISSLCAVGSIGIVPDSTTNTSAWSNIKWCSKETSDEASEHFLPYIQKGVIPYLNEKKGLDVKPNDKTEYEFQELKGLKAKITDGINGLITEKTWKKFVDETVDKYLTTLGALSEKNRKTLDAFREALQNMNSAGSFDPHGLLYGKPQVVKFVDIVLDTVFGHGWISGQAEWEDEIRFQLRYKMSGLTKGIIALSTIAGVGYGAMMLKQKMHNWSQERIAKEALEAKKKHQEKEDAQAKIFADKVDIDPKKINIEKLKTMLETEAKDWPYADTEITQFINTYIGIIEAKQKNPLAKCPPIILVGKPGCGKTEWIKRVINCTFNCIEYKNKNENKVKGKSKDTDKGKTNSKSEINWQDRCILINQDKIDKNSSVSPREQISGTHEEKREDVSITCYSDSAKANKFGKGIHLKYIDEIEKLLVDVILSIWDTADSGGRAIVLATGNGNPADYIKGDGADFKEAFEDRAIILEIPQPDKAYIRKSIKKLINDINNSHPDKSPVVVSEESLNGLVDACRSMRSVETMRSPILGLQISQTLKQRKSIPIKINPKNPKPERIILDESYQEKNTN